MKVCTSLTLVAFIICFSGCYSARVFNYELNEGNKDVIKHVFSSGMVSCTDGYCWHIDSEHSQNGSYTINGSRTLFMKMALLANEKNSDAFKVKLRVTNLGLRYRRVERPFLNELEGELFKANQGMIKEQITKILKEANDKSAKKRNK